MTILSLKDTTSGICKPLMLLVCVGKTYTGNNERLKTMKNMKINGQTITAKQFAWDTCHKIYLINTKKDEKTFLEYEYDLFPIKELEQAYANSCSLRFISHGDVELPNVVNQFETAVFE